MASLFSIYDIIWRMSYFVNKDFTVIAAQAPRGKQRRRRCTNATPIFFPEKENGRRPSKRKAFPIAGKQLEEMRRLPIALPIARRCRVEAAIRFASAPIIRCRSRILLRCSVIAVYRWCKYRGERSNAALAGKNKTAKIRSRRKLRKGSESQAKRQRR